jgi:hypothetical protein
LIEDSAGFLDPGVFMKMADNSSVRMISSEPAFSIEAFKIMGLIGSTFSIIPMGTGLSRQAASMGRFADSLRLEKGGD